MASEKDAQAKRVKPMRLPRSPFLSPARRAGDLALQPLSEALHARGFAGPEIIAQWPAIVGADLARMTAPDRIAWPQREPIDHARRDQRDIGATLHIRAEGPGAIEVQHMADLIVERVNQYLGFRAVGRLRITQAPVGQAMPARPPRQDGNQMDVSGQPPIRIEGIEKPALAEALARLGARVRRQGR